MVEPAPTYGFDHILVHSFCGFIPGLARARKRRTVCNAFGASSSMPPGSRQAASQNETVRRDFMGASSHAHLGLSVIHVTPARIGRYGTVPMYNCAEPRLDGWIKNTGRLAAMQAVFA